MKLKFLVCVLALLVIPSVVLAAENCTKEGGKDYYKAGTAIVGTDQYPDQCIDEVTLEEYYCDAQGLEYDYYTCPTSCVNGACSGGENATTPSCVENWQCTSWTACTGGQQTRTCEDLNKCGTTLNAPAVSQACTATTPPPTTTPATPPTTTTSWFAKYRYYIIGGIIVILIILYFALRKSEPKKVEPEVKPVEKK